MTGTSPHYKQHILCSYSETQFLFSGSAMSLGFHTGFGKSIGRLARSIATLGLDPSFWMLKAFASCRSYGVIDDYNVSVDDTKDALIFSATGGSLMSSLLYPIVVADWLAEERLLLFKDILHPALLCFGIRMGMEKSQKPITCRLSNGVFVVIDADSISVFGSSLEDLSLGMYDIYLDSKPLEQKQLITSKTYRSAKEPPAVKISTEGFHEVKKYFIESLVPTKDSSGAGE